MPRAILEWHNGNPEEFDRLVEARMRAYPDEEPRSIFRDALKDGIAAAESLGFGAGELQQHLEEQLQPAFSRRSTEDCWKASQRKRTTTKKTFPSYPQSPPTTSTTTSGPA